MTVHYNAHGGALIPDRYLFFQEVYATLHSEMLSLQATGGTDGMLMEQILP